jgi:hypothetical protein
MFWCCKGDPTPYLERALEAIAYMERSMENDPAGITARNRQHVADLRAHMEDLRDNHVIEVPVARQMHAEGEDLEESEDLEEDLDSSNRETHNR